MMPKSLCKSFNLQRSKMAVSNYYGPLYPKSALHQFYQKHSEAGIPVFSIESGPRPPALPSFTCTLTIPAVHTPLGGFEETKFTAWSRSKKSAEHAAAEKALAFLVSKGLLKASPPPNGADVTARPGNAIDITMREVRRWPGHARSALVYSVQHIRARLTGHCSH